MKFNTIFSTLAALAAATLTAANTVTFVPKDDQPRRVVFTPSVPHDNIPDAKVGGDGNVTVNFPEGWIGNWYAVDEDSQDAEHGMLGEVTFNGNNGFTYFDVSAIVDPSDHGGVREIFPAEAREPTSGCSEFPCDNAYYKWDDVQTKVTAETDLVCTLGG
jgi:hypothetical protein